LVAVKERELKVADNVRAAVSLLKTRYQAVLTHDSGHTKTGPTWIFTLPQPSSAQVAVRMNKRDLSVYLRDKTTDGRVLEPLLDRLAEVKERYPNPGKDPSNSLLSQEDAPYLRPSHSNQLLLIRPRPDSLEQILDIYLSRPSSAALPLATPAVTDPLTEVSNRQRTGRVVSADELLAQLDRNAATGRAGEEVVLADEMSRLRERGCTDPERYIELVALTDVGRGYDVASSWPGEERCIEAKTTTVAGSDFFLSENERQVLAELGTKSWLYRVVLQADGGGIITERIQNPIQRISDSAMRPVIWRVDADAFK
jgi:hypothetical protein